MATLEEKVAAFLAVSKGSGSGYGDGSGDGSGSGYGDGYGSGYGSSDGYGIRSFNGMQVYHVDGIQTIIRSVKGNIARGFILQQDLTLTETYIAKVGDYFAHGVTIEDAVRDATTKALENAPVEDRVDAFLVRYPADRSHSGSDLLSGHRLLTGSCEQGCQAFTKDRGIDLTAMFTVEEFIEIVSGAYPPGEDAIQELGKRL